MLLSVHYKLCIIRTLNYIISCKFLPLRLMGALIFPIQSAMDMVREDERYATVAVNEHGANPSLNRSNLGEASHSSHQLGKDSPPYLFFKNHIG